MKNPTIAIIGSGPAGCFSAQALQKSLPDARIDILERLPTPYGLVRYGVAPDHPGTKAVTRQFDRLFSKGNVRFVGNVEVGVDISLEAVRELYDVVILATGLYGDRSLNIPGESLDGVFRSGVLTRALNEHPESGDFTPAFGAHSVIIGNGNVAIDLLRMLAKRPDQFTGSELSERGEIIVASAKRHEIHIVGRSAAIDAKFDPVMVRELGSLDDVAFEVHDIDIDGTDGAPRLDALRQLVQGPRPATVRCRVHFHFGWEPECISGKHCVETITFRRRDNNAERLTLDTDSLITAIGFTDAQGVAFTRASLTTAQSDIEKGYLAPGLYCTGWFRRGPSGTIPENRKDAKDVISHIVESLAENRGYRPGFAGLPDQVRQKSIGYRQWIEIDRYETGLAPAGKTRRKVGSLQQLIQIARQHTEEA